MSYEKLVRMVRLLGRSMNVSEITRFLDFELRMLYPSQKDHTEVVGTIVRSL